MINVDCTSSKRSSFNSSLYPIKQTNEQKEIKVCTTRKTGSECLSQKKNIFQFCHQTNHASLAYNTFTPLPSLSNNRPPPPLPSHPAPPHKIPQFRSPRCVLRVTFLLPLVQRAVPPTRAPKHPTRLRL